MREHSPACPTGIAFGHSASARIGAVAFIHRFGSSLNEHVHFHCCVIDGVFAPALKTDNEEGVVFHAAAELDTRAVADVQARVRQRILRALVRRGLIEKDDAEKMAGWDHGGGFSVDASVRIEGTDRPGLERLLRYDQRKSPCGTAHAHPSHSNICSNATPGIWSTTAPSRAPTRPAIWY